MDVNTRHVIICDPQKGQMGSPGPHAGFRDGEKNVASGEVSDVA